MKSFTALLEMQRNEGLFYIMESWWSLSVDNLQYVVQGIAHSFHCKPIWDSHNFISSYISLPCCIGNLLFSLHQLAPSSLFFTMNNSVSRRQANKTSLPSNKLCDLSSFLLWWTFYPHTFPWKPSITLDLTFPYCSPSVWTDATHSRALNIPSVPHYT